jgi:hypothetical protein
VRYRLREELDKSRRKVQKKKLEAKLQSVANDLHEKNAVIAEKLRMGFQFPRNLDAFAKGEH